MRLTHITPATRPRSLACHPSKAEVACGFQSGALRIWDASSTALLHESRQHTGPVVQVAFARHGRLLLSLGEMPAAVLSLMQCGCLVATVCADE